MIGQLSINGGKFFSIKFSNPLVAKMPVIRDFGGIWLHSSDNIKWEDFEFTIDYSKEAHEIHIKHLIGYKPCEMFLKMGSSSWKIIGVISRYEAHVNYQDISCDITVTINHVEEKVEEPSGGFEELMSSEKVIFLKESHPYFSFRNTNLAVQTYKLTLEEFVKKVREEDKFFLIHTFRPEGEEIFIRCATADFDGIKEYHAEDYITRLDGKIVIDTSKIKESPYFPWYLELIAKDVSGATDVFGNLTNLTIHSRYGLSS